MTRPATEAEPPLQLEAFLPYRLAVAAEAVSRGLAAVYSDQFGLTIPEWRIIANLGRHGALTAGDVGQRSSLDKVQVSRAIRRLQARRLVMCRRGRVDRREVHISLTSAGERMFGDIAALALAWERELLADYAEEDKAVLNDWLQRLAARAAHDMR